MKSTCLALALALAGCQTGPNNGTVYSGTVAGKSFNFNGYYDAPDATIRVEVLKEPTLDPDVDANWTLLAVTQTGTDPQPLNNPSHPLYAWSVNATPVPANPSSTQAKRWPQGGILRVRAVHVTSSGQRRLLTTFDNVTSDCLGKEYSAGQPWDVIGTKCEGLGDHTVAIVSTSTLPDPAGGFLTDKGIGSEAATLAYYLQINAPTSLANFRARYGFISDPASVVSARYYNDGDLGLGREMNCKAFAAFPTPGVACYVRNYSDAPGKVATFTEDPDDVIAQTVSGQGAFATVAMVYQPNLPIQFIVYNAAGNWQLSAPLDASQDNVSIPQNCLSCHGIDATFSNGAVAGNAEFLPFDPYAFKFSSQAPWRLADQQNALRKLNQLVLLTQPPPATVDLIAGLYAPKSVNDATAVANNTYVPTGWEPNATLDGKALYNGVVKPYCRTCHVSSNNSALDFDDYGDFSQAAAQIRGVICGTKKMPHAERVQKKLWQSGARAYVVTGLPAGPFPDALQACKP